MPLGWLTILSGIAGLHSWFTGLKAGDERQRILQELEKTKTKVDQLSEHILHVPSLQEIMNIGETQENRLSDGRQLREILDPVQRALGEEILSTAVLSTSDKLREAFSRDPWSVLVEIRPVARAVRPTNPDLVPILFADQEISYIGWQTSGALPILLGCEYKPYRIRASDSTLEGPHIQATGKDHKGIELSQKPDEASPAFVELPPDVEEKQRRAEAEAKRKAAEKEKQRQAEAEAKRKAAERRILQPLGVAKAAPQEAIIFQHAAFCDTAFGKLRDCTVTVSRRALEFVSPSARKYSFELSRERLAQSNLRSNAPDELKIEFPENITYSVVLSCPSVEELISAIRTIIGHHSGRA